VNTIYLWVLKGKTSALRAPNWFENWSGFTPSEGFCNFLRKFLFPLDLPRESRLDCFGCLHSGGDHQLRRQLWIGISQWIVGRFMQRNTVLLLMPPSVSCHCIETCRVLLNGFKQHIILFSGGQQWKADGSLHKAILAQIF